MSGRVAFIADDNGALTEWASCNGTGSPEGVVTAPAGSLYVQTDASAGGGLWYKKTGSGNTGWEVAGSNGWAKLFDTTLGADTATIDTGAGGIPAGYDVLKLLIIARTDEAVQSSQVQLRFNGDTAGNYTRTYTGQAGGGAVNGFDTAAASFLFPVPGSSQPANAPAMWSGEIPGYAGTTFHKVGNLDGGISTTSGSNSQAYHIAFSWRNTGAITRIEFSCNTAGKKLVAGSRMVIYGR